MFHQGQGPGRNRPLTDPRRELPLDLNNLLWAVVLVICCFSFYVLAAEIDARDEANARRLAKAEKRLLAMPTTARDAYEQGMADAMQAASACAAGARP